VVWQGSAGDCGPYADQIAISLILIADQQRQSLLQVLMFKSAQSGFSPHLLRRCVPRGTLSLRVTGLSLVAVK